MMPTRSPLPNPQRDERLRQSIGARLDLAKGERRAEKRGRRRIRRLDRGRRENLVERSPRIGHARRDPVVVMLQPRPRCIGRRRRRRPRGPFRLEIAHGHLESSVSGNGPAAIDDDDLSGNVVGRVRGQKDGDALELALSADAGNRARRLDRRLGERNRRIGEP